MFWGGFIAVYFVACFFVCFDKAESHCVALADLELVRRVLYFMSVQEVNLSTHCRTQVIRCSVSFHSQAFGP